MKRHTTSSAAIPPRTAKRHAPAKPSQPGMAFDGPADRERLLAELGFASARVKRGLTPLQRELAFGRQIGSAGVLRSAWAYPGVDLRESSQVAEVQASVDQLPKHNRNSEWEHDDLDHFAMLDNEYVGGGGGGPLVENDPVGRVHRNFPGLVTTRCNLRLQLVPNASTQALLCV